MKAVFDEWRSYFRDVVPAGAPTVQIEECRRAFYAGANSMLALVFEAMEPKDEHERDRNLGALDDELRAFMKTFKV